MERRPTLPMRCARSVWRQACVGLAKCCPRVCPAWRLPFRPRYTPAGGSGCAPVGAAEHSHEHPCRCVKALTTVVNLRGDQENFRRTSWDFHDRAERFVLQHAHQRTVAIVLGGALQKESWRKLHEDRRRGSDCVCRRDRSGAPGWRLRPGPLLATPEPQSAVVLAAAVKEVAGRPVSEPRCGVPVSQCAALSSLQILAYEVGEAERPKRSDSRLATGAAAPVGTARKVHVNVNNQPRACQL